MIPAGQQADTIRSIAERYGVAEDTVTGWVRHPQFPRHSGTPRHRQFPRGAVDDWVERYRPALRQAAVEQRPAAGAPGDLLGPDEVAQARAARLGGRPVSAGTISSYVTRGQMPPPDRRPGDRLQPPVERNSWYRSTVDAHLATLQGRGNRTRTRRVKRDPTETS